MLNGGRVSGCQKLSSKVFCLVLGGVGSMKSIERS
jgi:hypothetical protein